MPVAELVISTCIVHVLPVFKAAFVILISLPDAVTVPLVQVLTTLGVDDTSIPVRGCVTLMAIKFTPTALASKV